MARRLVLALALAAGAAALSAFPAASSHAWGRYHWPRPQNPLALTVVDSVTSSWDAYLDGAIADWAASSVLDLTKEAGSTGSADRRRCKPAAGKIRACNYAYGFNGWLGLAQIWVSGDHITQAVTKVNDSYLNTSPYNTPPWRRLVMCQEVGHDFGLAHQDESFSNPNLGTCMDYTSDPDGPPSNEHPNAHDYEQLEAIYSHLDSTSSASSEPGPGRGRGKVERVTDSLWIEDLGNGRRLFTWILWTSPRAVHGPPFGDD